MRSSGDRGEKLGTKTICKKCGVNLFVSRMRYHLVDPLCEIRVWRQEMNDKEFGILTPQMQSKFGQLGVKVLIGPYGISTKMKRKAKILNAAWAPIHVIRAYETRDESAHTKAAWVALLINPQFCNSGKGESDGGW